MSSTFREEYSLDCPEYVRSPERRTRSNGAVACALVDGSDKELHRVGAGLIGSSDVYVGKMEPAHGCQMGLLDNKLPLAFRFSEAEGG